MTRATAPIDDGKCIGCGPDSGIGLRMQFARCDDGSVTSRLTVSADYQSWRGVVHGGIVALLLDEAMAYAAAATGALGMTGELKLRFRKEIAVGAELVVRGAVLWQRRSVLALEASIVASDGSLLASGEGKFVSQGTVEPGTRLGFMRDSRAGR